MFRLVRIKQSRPFRISSSLSSSSSASSSSRPFSLSSHKRPDASWLAAHQPSQSRPLLAREALQLPRRWQSTDTEQKAADSTTSAPAPPPGDSEAPKPEEDGAKELEAKNRELIEVKDRYLRSVADFRNLQERSKRDMESARQFAIQRFASDLIESIDNLDRALGAVPPESLAQVEGPAEQDAPNKDLINLHGGLKMTESILMGTLKKHGLERFDPVEDGRKFDPRLDEATFMTKVEGKEDGDAIHTQSKGFLLNGRVLRAAKVGVVKNS